MRTEDLLAVCLEARAQGRPATAILAAQATADQRREVEALLALVARLEQAAPPRRPPAYRPPPYPWPGNEARVKVTS
ncbi:MAG: hypothetical protein M3Z04_02635 [Chloroflexota bacterium]|nr:hypothetical protein [Chloroflexota bacterium]